jgi:hypothetical protein
MGWLDKIILGSSGALDAYENARETKKKDPDKKKYSDKGKIIFTGDSKKDREIAEEVTISKEDDDRDL